MESAFQHRRLTLPLVVTQHPLLRRQSSPPGATLPAKDGAS
jgi:hypothetical protein